MSCRDRAEKLMVICLEQKRVFLLESEITGAMYKMPSPHCFSRTEKEESARLNVFILMYSQIRNYISRMFGGNRFK